jgi:hypothetical protein
VRPALSERNREIGDLGMAGLHSGAPARIARGGRAIQPGGGSSTPLVRDPEEILVHTFLGSSASVNYRRRLEMNTQDSNEDVLFRQEMRYPERGAGGFSNIRQAEGEECQASPPVQPPEEPRRPLGSKLAPEQGRSLPRRSPEDRFGAGLEEDAAEEGIGGEEPESAGRGSV